MHRSGLIGVALSGNVEIDAIVAQGCRPIGVPMFVTRCRENSLLELDGRSPLWGEDLLAQRTCSPMEAQTRLDRRWSAPAERRMESR